LKAATDAAWNRKDARAAALCLELGSHLFSLDRFTEAEPYLQSAFQVRQELFGLENREAIKSLYSLALNKSWTGSLDQAIHLMRQALDLSERILGFNDLETVKVLSGLGLLCLRTREPAGRSYCEQALTILEDLGSTERVLAAEILNDLGCIHLGRSEWTQALVYFNRALAPLQGTEHEYCRVAASVLGNAAQAFANLGDLSQERDFCEQALVACEQSLGSDHQRLVGHLVDLASSCEARGAQAAAGAHYKRALDIRAKVLGSDAVIMMRPRPSAHHKWAKHLPQFVYKLFGVS
jgi:tetratricopeptide (TPR) repeat protein